MVYFINRMMSLDVAKGVDSLITKSQNLLFGPIKKKIFYLHIHKCGGISITNAIKSCYQTVDIFKERQSYYLLDARASYNAYKKFFLQNNLWFNNPKENLVEDDLELKFRESLLLYHLSQDHINYIAGHFCFNEEIYNEFSKNYTYITVLRDPVERWISLYFWKKFNKNGHRNIELEFDEYLKSDYGRARGHSYVKFLGGLNPENDYTSRQAINKAIGNLHKFNIIGFLEYQDDFLYKFEKELGRKLNIRKLNKNPKSKAYQNSFLTESIRDRIREICMPDIEIYEYAIKNFIAQKIYQ